MDAKFCMEEIEKTIKNYRAEQLTEGIVVAVKENGLVFNLGGKLDAFIPKEEVEDFSGAKIGDRYPVFITGGKNEDGMVLASQKKAIKIQIETQNAKEIKLGGVFLCQISSFFDGNLVSKMGEYEIIIPETEISSVRRVNPKFMIGKKVEAIATDINSEEKTIKASIRILDDRIRANNEEVFWRTNFVNKIVDGTVKRFVPYGAFVEVGGVDCLLHISNISYKRINSAGEVLKLGETRKFKILEMNQETKRVSIGLKQLEN